MAVSTQCKVCNLGEEIYEDVRDMRNLEVSYRGIALSLEEMGESISASSIKRHFRNHVISDDKYEEVQDVPEADVNLGQMTLTSEGGEFKDVRTEKLITDWTEVFLRFNLDPEKFEIVNDTVRMSTWQQSKRTEDGHRDIINLYSYRALFKKKSEVNAEVHLPSLVTSVRERAAKILNPDFSQADVDTELGIITCFSDLQVGKTDHRGGTAELLDRAYSSLANYENYLKSYRPQEVLFADLGDIVEGFNSTASEMFTNDLSIMDQVDLAHTIVSEFLSVTAQHTNRVIAAGVPSNHAAWRKGKDYLGTPADDWGLYILRMIEKEYLKYGLNEKVEFVYPNRYEKSLNVNIMGTGIGLVHGDDWSGGPNGAATWWQKQQHGGGPTSRSDILVHGHYHTFLAKMDGRTPEKNQKYIISASTLDSGSSWFANGNGGTDSEAGLTVFGVRKGTGIDLSTLRVLK